MCCSADMPLLLLLPPRGRHLDPARRCSFSHVLGIDGDACNVVAAKAIKAKGELAFTPVPADGSNGAVAVARVPDSIDRDRVLFW